MMYMTRQKPKKIQVNQCSINTKFSKINLKQNLHFFLDLDYLCVKPMHSDDRTITKTNNVFPVDIGGKSKVGKSDCQGDNGMSIQTFFYFAHFTLCVYFKCFSRLLGTAWKNLD